MPGCLDLCHLLLMPLGKRKKKKIKQNLDYFPRFTWSNHWKFCYNQSLQRIITVFYHISCFVTIYTYASFHVLVWVFLVCKLCFWYAYNTFLEVTTLVISWFYFCYFWTFSHYVYIYYIYNMYILHNTHKALLMNECISSGIVWVLYKMHRRIILILPPQKK